MIKINFVFQLISLQECNTFPNFDSNFLKNSDYISDLNSVYSLQNVSIYMKSPIPDPTKGLDELISRPKSSSVSKNSPTKSNSLTYLGNNESKGKYFSPQQQSPSNFLQQTPPVQMHFPLPKFPCNNRNSGSPGSHNSINSPKKSYEGLFVEPVQNEREESPSNFIGELPPFEEMKGNILNIAKSQSGSR